MLDKDIKTVDDVIEMFKYGLDCGQVIVYQIAREMHIDPTDAMKMAAPFGGGVFEGGVCGSYIGGLLAVGLKYGHSKPEDEKKADLIKKTFFYKEAFSKLHNSTECSGILGYNLSIPEENEKIMEENLMFTVCPKLVLDVIDIVRNL